MDSWRNTILKEFIPKVAKLTLVSDPDHLLSEEKLVTELRNRGFEIIEFNNPIEFRYAYESKYRSYWDKGEYTDLVVILRTQGKELSVLPYDLLQAGRKLSFNLGEIFPNMSYPVIEKLDRSLLDPLFDSQKEKLPDRMGDNATKDFILRHVFGIVAELISTEVEFLRFLFRIHYGNYQIPAMLIDRLVEVFNNSGRFKDWNLLQIISDSEYFFTFVQERWPLFLKTFMQKENLKNDLAEQELKIEGPVDLQFDHHDIRIYIDNLFVEGKLKPIECEIDIEKDLWILSGISSSKKDTKELRISRLLEGIETSKLSLESRYNDWLLFAMKWAELSALINTSSYTRYIGHYKKFAHDLNNLFADWLETHYASLINLPPSTPTMLHHIPRYLVRYMEDETDTKIALLVIDGLSLEQWVTIRNIIQKQNIELVLRESATFAWIPTLTSVSRQAIFSGKPPIYFPTSINSTNSEEKLWKQFWQDYNISKFEIAYKRSLGDGNPVAILDSFINPSKTKVIGLVIDKIDKIMHGMQLGATGMHNQIEQWCEGGYLISLLNHLLVNGYKIWITSDHGNIESVGKGQPSEGSIAENRGERVRVYTTQELRSQISSSLNYAREWIPFGLPNNYLPLVATGNNAFIKEGDSIVGHGGISIEEVLVPFIKVERKEQ